MTILTLETKIHLVKPLRKWRLGMNEKDIVIVAAARTPIGSFIGSHALPRAGCNQGGDDPGRD
jgi:hypothetical protein